MPGPSPESVELAKSILDQEGNPFVEFLATAVAEVMRLNYNGLAELLDERRAEFEERGAEDLLREIQSDVDNLFAGFVNTEEE